MTVIRRTTVEIDVMRLDKSKLREWKKNDGTTAKFLSLDIIETDSPKPVTKKDGTIVGSNGRVLTNIGFVVQSKASKDEPNGDIIGNVKEWKDGEEQPAPQNDGVDPDIIDENSIPF